MAKSSAGQPPVPDGLAHMIILKVPPDLGVSDVVGEGVGVVAGVDAVGVGAELCLLLQRSCGRC